VAAHDLEDDDSVVGFGGRVQAIDRVRAYLHRGVEAEREVGSVQIVVDRLGYADDVDAFGGELVRHAEGVLASDRDQRIDVLRAEVVANPLDALVFLEGVRSRGAEDRSSSVQGPTGVLGSEIHGVVLEDAAPSVAVADDRVAVLVDALSYDRAYDRVQSGAVPSPGKDADPSHTDPLRT
jgi:hypothetical protein